MATITPTEYHVASHIREDLIREIREAASKRHLPAIDALVEWAEGGFEGDAPVVPGIAKSSFEDLVDDLRWMFQAKLPEGWFTSQYARKYAKRRYRAAASASAAARRKSDYPVLRDLLSF